MKKRKIELGYLEITNLAKQYIKQVLDTTRLSSGPFMERFETEFAARHNCKHAIMLNSGTSALHVAVAVLKELGGWKDGDEVLVPASTFIASSNVVIHNNLIPVFVDINPQTYNIDPLEIEKHVTKKTRAIMPVHMYGQPCDMDKISDTAKRHRLKVIEDSCECMFSSFKGQVVGSIGDIGCFSTYLAHILTTGAGGLITTNNDEYAMACRSLMAHGRDNIYLKIDDDDTKDPEQLRSIVSRRFNFVRLGHNFRATEFEAALGLAQLQMADHIIQSRRRNGATITKRLESLSQWLQLPEVAPDREHSFMMYPIVCKKGIKRDEIVNYLEERGVETRYMMPLLSQPVYQKLFGEGLENNYPVAKWVTHNGFYLPCHQGLIADDIEFIDQTIHEYLTQISLSTRNQYCA